MESKIYDVDVEKLKTVSVDLNKLVDAVGNYVVKKTEHNSNWIKK